MKQPEVWMRGPITGVPALLQPVAHTLLQAGEEIHELFENFPESLLWEQPAGMASPAFHLQHITGVLDRLFTYAAAIPLSEEQLAYLASEGRKNEEVTIAGLIAALDRQIKLSVDKLKDTNETTLTSFRGVGRKQLPSTVIGLLFHAAEHTMRHNGQLLVTVKILLQ